MPPQRRYPDRPPLMVKGTLFVVKSKRTSIPLSKAFYVKMSLFAADGKQSSKSGCLFNRARSGANPPKGFRSSKAFCSNDGIVVAIYCRSQSSILKNTPTVPLPRLLIPHGQRHVVCCNGKMWRTWFYTYIEMYLFKSIFV